VVLVVVLVVSTAAHAEKGPDKHADKAERELPVPALFGRVSPSVVVIDARGKDHLQGSGVVVGPGQVVTNYHVINGATSLEVRQGERRWPATAEAIDPKRDLAVLAIKSFDLPRVTLRPSSALVVGERVYAVGAPRGLELTLSDGLISALRRDRPDKTEKNDKGDKSAPTPDAPALIQTTVPISPGSSGGGLFDAQGRLVGITTFFRRRGAQSAFFAIPVDWIESLPSVNIAAAADVRPFWMLAQGEQPLFLQVAGYEADGKWAEMKAAARLWTEAEPDRAQSWEALSRALMALGDVLEGSVARFRASQAPDAGIPGTP